MNQSICFRCFIFLFFLSSVLYGQDTSQTPDSPIPDKPKYRFVSINPGVTLESVSLSIQGRNRDALMVQDDPGRVSWLFDVKSPEYQISKYFGVNLLLHNSNFYLNRQSIPKIFSKSASVESSSSESNSSSSDGDSISSKSNKVTEDVGTNVEGSYSMLVPIFYIGNPDTFRLGFGMGPAHVRLRGNVDFKDTASNLLIAFSGPGRNSFLNNLGAYQFVSGNLNPNSDPTLTYLVANLSTGNNLELVGYYLGSQGLLRPDTTALAAYFSGRFNAVESLAISSLMRNQVRVNAVAKFAFMMYLESPPFLGLRARVSFGGPIVKENGYSYELRTFHLALYMPIEF
ncbi:MAG: hypothetical protein IBJ01_17800 [Leptospira sp.]|uniref:hypothetical protein n=1 Tax=Leptospira sp. TaxID=178 RepID=UPI0025C22DEE|nr:hypothetical protein [Leptospira sp.]MBL0956614.1 hypothetical protein [Leptospira sp.]